MNKNLLKICFIAALLMSASSVYAAGTLISGTTIIGGGTFSPSNKVTIGALSTATNYAAETKHASGDRIIGTNNTDPKMYWTTGVVGSPATAPATATVDYSTWTSLQSAILHEALSCDFVGWVELLYRETQHCSVGIRFALPNLQSQEQKRTL